MSSYINLILFATSWLHLLDFLLLCTRQRIFYLPINKKNLAEIVNCARFKISKLFTASEKIRSSVYLWRTLSFYLKFSFETSVVLSHDGSLIFLKTFLRLYTTTGKKLINIGPTVFLAKSEKTRRNRQYVTRVITFLNVKILTESFIWSYSQLTPL